MKRIVFAALAVAALAADFKDVDPNVFPKDDPRAKELPRMVSADVNRRMQEANVRESQAFAAAAQNKEQWEAYRDVRIKALKDALGTFPDVPKDMKVVVTRKLDGDGYIIHNVVYETRPGLWVSANLYLPAKPVASMPGLIISHAHHTPKGQGELQDMGMTWARTGCAVLVPDHLGHGERRQHDFLTEKDYPKAFRPSRQDYFFRYNSNLQLSAVGDSLMGWMAWDLIRGIDVLLKQPGIDPKCIIMLGAVAGGGDPAGVTAALDPRIACVVPFNFGGWQPESSVTPLPDRDFDWFGDGYWESTRGLRGGAAGGFAHFVIVGSIAPRKLIYAHEFAWDPNTDPAWPRFQTIYRLYGAKESIAVAHGAGSVRNSGPGNTHCTHIGAVHRKMIYPALKEWFGMPVPEEYSQRRTGEELLCWTEAAKKDLKPKKLHEVLGPLADDRIAAAGKRLSPLAPEKQREQLRTEWAKLLGDPTPPATSIAGAVAHDIPGGGYLRRQELHVETGWPPVVPFLLLTPTAGSPKKGKWPVVVMVAQAGKAAFLKERGDAIAAFLKAGIAVALVDVRGTGETKAGGSAERGSSRTSISQTGLILGRPHLAVQLRDLRATIRHLQNSDILDARRIAVWGDSFTPPNSPDRVVAVPLDAPDQPTVAEPGGATLALLAALYEDDVKAVYANGGLTGARAILSSPYVWVPHEAIVPGAVGTGDLGRIEAALGSRLRTGGRVNGLNHAVDGKTVSTAEAATWVIERLQAK